MPGLSETALNEAARPLDDLDEYRRNVADLGKTEVALAAIVGVYRDYALTQLHAEQNRAKRMSSSFKQARKQLKNNNDEAEVANLADAQASVRRSMLEHHSVQIEQKIHALQRSTAYTEGQQLEDLRKHVLSLESRSACDQASHEEQKQRQPAFIKAVVNAKHFIDVTGNLVQSIWQHRNEVTQGFTQKYRVHKLVYYEIYDEMIWAILREKRFKQWNRRWKVNLIEAENPTWADL